MSNVVNGIKDVVTTLLYGTAPGASDPLALPAGQDRSERKSSHSPEGEQVELYSSRWRATPVDPLRHRHTASHTTFLLDIPTYDDEATRNYTDRQREASRSSSGLLKTQMAKVRPKGGFRVTNTLNDRPHQPRRQDSGVTKPFIRPSGQHRDANGGSPVGRLQAQKSMGGNVKPGREGGSSGALEMEASTRAAKRQKLDRDTSRLSQEQIQIVDDDEELQADRPRAKHNSTDHAGGQRTAKTFKDTVNSFQSPQVAPTNKKDLFGNQESRSAHRYLGTETSQRKNRARGSQSQSSKGPSQSPSPTALDSLSQDTSRGVKPFLQREEDTRVLLEDKLGKSDRYNDKHLPPAKTSPNAASFAENARYLMEKSDLTKLQDSSFQHRERRMSSSRHNGQRREDRRPKASQRMLAEPGQGIRVSPIRDESDGEDELQGGNTTLHRGFTGGSPRSHGSARLAHNRSKKRSASPSDIAPTNFKSRKEGEDGPLRIPIKEIYSRGFIGHKGLELVWDQEDKVLYVEQYNERVRSKGKDRMIFFGASETRKWIGTNSRLLAARITGSQTENSVGQIFIVFENQLALSDCFNCLSDANPSIETETYALERMKSIMATQLHLIQEDSYRQARVQASHKDQELTAIRQRHGTHLTRQSIPSQMSNKDAVQSRASSRMLASNSRPSPSSSRISLTKEETDEKSRYFETDVCRSTRKTRASRQKTPTPEQVVRWTEQNRIPEWKEPITYPISGKKAVTVEFRDLQRLDDGEFLNDNLVNFGLRQVQESMSAEVQENVHFFNTYFYSSLLNQKSRGPIHYDKVKRWTRNVDLFNIPYVVIPFNLDLHWFVAIICNLPNIPRELGGISEEGLETLTPTHDAPLDSSKPGSPSYSQVEVQDSQELLKDAQSERPAQPQGAGEDVSGGSSPFQTIVEFDDNGQVVMESKSKPPAKSVKRNGRNLRAIPPDKPVILTLDSFGSPHASEVRNIKAYLAAEAREKRGMFIDASGSKYIQGITAKGIPEQTNFCDCGVFLIEYIHRFAKNPKDFVEKAINRQMDIEGTFGNFDPSTKRAELREALLELDRQREHPEQPKATPAKSQASISGAPKVSKAGDVGHAAHKAGEVTPKDRSSRVASSARSTPHATHVSQEKEISIENDIDVDDGLETKVPRAFAPRAKDQAIQYLGTPEVTKRGSEEKGDLPKNADDEFKKTKSTNPQDASSQDANSDNDKLRKKMDDGSPVDLLKQELRNQAVKVVTSNQLPDAMNGDPAYTTQKPRTLPDAAAKDKNKRHHQSSLARGEAPRNHIHLDD